MAGRARYCFSACFSPILASFLAIIVMGGCLGVAPSTKAAFYDEGRKGRKSVGPDLRSAQIGDPSNSSISSSAGTNQALRLYAGLIDRVVIGGLLQSRGIVHRGCGVLGSSSDQMMCAQGLRIAESQIHNAQRFISNPSIQIPDCVGNIHERLREGLERVAQGYTAAQSGMSARDMGSYHTGIQDVEAGESLVIEANSDLKAKSASGLCLPR
jgi:hypothetical protein